MQSFLEKFSALSDETRLRLLYLVLTVGKELCGCELVDALEIPQYNISRHLKILHQAGLIKERKEGRWVYYSATPQTDEFTQGLYLLVRSINHKGEARFSRDRKELKNRLKLRENGKCLLGIQKSELAIPSKGKKS